MACTPLAKDNSLINNILQCNGLYNNKAAIAFIMGICTIELQMIKPIL